MYSRGFFQLPSGFWGIKDTWLNLFYLLSLLCCGRNILFGHEIWKLSSYYISLEVHLQGKKNMILWHNHTMTVLWHFGNDNVKNPKMLFEYWPLNPPLLGLQQCTVCSLADCVFCRACLPADCNCSLLLQSRYVAMQKGMMKWKDTRGFCLLYSCAWSARKRKGTK